MLKSAPAQGYSVDDVRKAIKAIDVLVKAKEQAEFEDDIWEFIKEIVNKGKYRVATPELLEFLDEFK